MQPASNHLAKPHRTLSSKGSGEPGDGYRGRWMGNSQACEAVKAKTSKLSKNDTSSDEAKPSPWPSISCWNKIWDWSLVMLLLLQIKFKKDWTYWTLSTCINSWFSSTCPRFLEMIDKQILESTLGAPRPLKDSPTPVLCVLPQGGKILVTKLLRCTKITTTSENGAKILVCIKRLPFFETWFNYIKYTCEKNQPKNIQNIQIAFHPFKKIFGGNPRTLIKGFKKIIDQEESWWVTLFGLIRFVQLIGAGVGMLKAAAFCLVGLGPKSWYRQWVANGSNICELQPFWKYSSFGTCADTRTWKARRWGSLVNKRVKKCKVEGLPHESNEIQYIISKIKAYFIFTCQVIPFISSLDSALLITNLPGNDNDVLAHMARLIGNGATPSMIGIWEKRPIKFLPPVRVLKESTKMFMFKLTLGIVIFETPAVHWKGDKKEKYKDSMPMLLQIFK